VDESGDVLLRGLRERLAAKRTCRMKAEKRQGTAAVSQTACTSPILVGGITCKSRTAKRGCSSRSPVFAARRRLLRDEDRILVRAAWELQPYLTVPVPVIDWYTPEGVAFWLVLH
jgi:hypothetical protein